MTVAAAVVVGLTGHGGAVDTQNTKPYTHGITSRYTNRFVYLEVLQCVSSNITSGLLHASNISQGKFKAVSDVLTVGEKVKVLVIRSFFPEKISLRYVRSKAGYCGGMETDEMRN
ncbi:uncharacterized protein LOC141600031 isoform X2 [Silene latifolia]|uniref:uncharacterized protein LOC141600031 isoform X2 n=1 Tax=Silene latifolia TaxID=37657 RepID=UPI003D785072